MSVQTSLAHSPISLARLQRSDSRADDRVRDIAIRSQCVVIARRVAGIAMEVRVPLSSYQGLSLSPAGPADGGRLARIELLHEDPDLSISLCDASDSAETAAQWAAWAHSLSLPLIGAEAAACATPSASVPRLPWPRRRGSLVASRRTRFARRRKMGVLRRLATTYRQEREIICYE